MGALAVVVVGGSWLWGNGNITMEKVGATAQCWPDYPVTIHWQYYREYFVRAHSSVSVWTSQPTRSRFNLSPTKFIRSLLGLECDLSISISHHCSTHDLAGDHWSLSSVRLQQGWGYIKHQRSNIKQCQWSSGGAETKAGLIDYSAGLGMSRLTTSWQYRQLWGPDQS